MMRVDIRMPAILSRLCLLAAAGLFFSASPAQAAKKSLSGTYTCVSAEVDGKIRHCTAPSIEMSSDGSYQILTERGTYEIWKGHWLILSASKHHGAARLEGKKIIFEFLSGGKKSKITYRRKFQRPPDWSSS
jgi:hypothetical protein